MRKVQLTEAYFHGAVSVEFSENGAKPWRVPYDQAALFVPNHINGKAEVPAGVRVSFRSDTSTVQLEVQPDSRVLQMDCVVDGSLFQMGNIPPGEKSVSFDGLPIGEKLIEIYLSQKLPIRITGLMIDAEASFVPFMDARPRWIAYGSSITQCVEAESPAQTWPALAAQKLGLNLTCLGFAGNCHMEPMIARMIRDMPADFISLCIGINIMGGSTYSARTFAPALIGFIQTIREKHPDIPIAVSSPIYCAARETTPNKVGFTLQLIREEIRNVVELLSSREDRNLHYLDGLELFGEAYAEYFPDGLHPNADGYRIMANHFSERIHNKASISIK